MFERTKNIFQKFSLKNVRFLADVSVFREVIFATRGKKIPTDRP